MGEPVQIADTSFLYALFSKSDAFHGKARKAAAAADSILVPSEIYSETVSLIHYRVGFAAAKSAGTWMWAQRRMQVAPSSRSLLEGCWGIFGAALGRLCFPDAVVLAWCWERREVPLLFDPAILHSVM